MNKELHRKVSLHQTLWKNSMLCCSLPLFPQRTLFLGNDRWQQYHSRNTCTLLFFFFWLFKAWVLKHMVFENFLNDKFFNLFYNRFCYKKCILLQKLIQRDFYRNFVWNCLFDLFKSLLSKPSKNIDVVVVKTALMCY